jgi:hypothetical protein
MPVERPEESNRHLVEITARMRKKAAARAPPVR